MGYIFILSDILNKKFPTSRSIQEKPSRILWYLVDIGYIWIFK